MSAPDWHGPAMSFAWLRNSSIQLLLFLCFRELQNRSRAGANIAGCSPRWYLLCCMYSLISSTCVYFPAIQCFHSDLRSAAKSIYPLWCADGNNLQKDAFLSFIQYVFVWEVQLFCEKVQSKTIWERTANPTQAALLCSCAPLQPSGSLGLLWCEGNFQAM